MGLIRPKAAKDQCDQIAAMVAAGASFKDAGEKFGVSAVAAWKACERRGVRSVRSKRPPAMVDAPAAPPQREPVIRNAHFAGSQ